MSEAVPPADIQFEHQPERFRTSVRLVGTVSGARFTRVLTEWVLDHPEAAWFDTLYDLIDYEGGVTHPDLLPVAALYDRLKTPESARARTALVGADRTFPLWASALDYTFDGRTYAGFRTLEEAEVFLSVPRAERRSGESGGAVLTD
jgi:hypothetical protein